MSTQAEARLPSSMPSPSPSLSDGKGRKSGEQPNTNLGAQGPTTPPGSEPDMREQDAEGATQQVPCTEPALASISTATSPTPSSTPALKAAKIPSRPQALGRIRAGEVLYLEPPTPTQPLLQLSPTPMSFPSSIHTFPPASSSKTSNDVAATTTRSPNPKSSNSSSSSPSTSDHHHHQPPIISPVTSPPYWHTQQQQPQQPDARRRRQESDGDPPRPTSWASTDSVNFAGITLCDNEVDARNAACWAKSVTIRDYTIVNGSSRIPSVLRPALSRVGSSQPASRSGGGVVHGGAGGGVMQETVDDDVVGDGGGGGMNVKARLGMGGIGAFVVFNVVIETLDGAGFEIKRRYSEFDGLRSKLVKTFPKYEKAMPELPPKSLVSRFRPRFLEQRRRGLEYFLGCVLLNPQFAGSPVTKEFIFN